MKGHRIALSVPRRIICDLMHFSSGVPTIPVQRHMNLASVVSARKLDRTPWSAIFIKAFAVVAQKFPELRRVYCKFPRPHLYQYPVSVAHLTLEREYQGEPAIFGIRIKDPASRSIFELGNAIREASSAPIAAIKDFRKALRFGAWPRPLRRALWWIALNIGRIRPNYFGTFGLSVYSGLGAESLHPLSPLTSTLNYGVIAPDGSVDVRLIYDHRVMDGATVARALNLLEDVLNTSIHAELISPQHVKFPAGGARRQEQGADKSVILPSAEEIEGIPK